MLVLLGDFRGGLVRYGHFADKGQGSSSGINVRTFWCKKRQNFLKFMVCPLGMGSQFFAILCGRIS